jgi:type III secretion system PrgH/EprH family protein
VFSLKILSGLMYGVAITLPAEDIFFVAGPLGESVAEGGEHIAAQAGNTLFIPAGSGAPNFRLGLSDATAPQAWVFYELGVEPLALTFNQPLKVGEVWLALKPQDDDWSAAVLDFSVAQGITSAAPAPNRTLRVFSLALLLGLVLALVLTLAFWGRGLYEARLLRGLMESLGPLSAEVMPGRDGQHYVMVDSARHSGVARRLIARDGVKSASITVLRQAAERRRLERLLDQAAIAFVAVRLDDPRKPIVLLTDETPMRADSAAQEKLRRLLCEWAPYASTVEIRFISRAQLYQLGQELLAKASVRYERRDEGNSQVFLIRQALDDRQINEINVALQDFRRLWGDRIVRFQLSLDEHPLRGKTFRSGTSGYVLEKERHWIYSSEQAGVFSTES